MSSEVSLTFPCSQRKWKFYAKWLRQSMKPHAWMDKHSFTYIINILQYVTNIWVPSMRTIVSIDCLKVGSSPSGQFPKLPFILQKEKLKKKMFSFLGSNPKILLQPTRRMFGNNFKIFDQIECKLILFEVS
jgi:hypothetical protein